MVKLLLLSQSIEWIYVSVSFPLDYFKTILREKNATVLAQYKRARALRARVYVPSFLSEYVRICKAVDIKCLELDSEYEYDQKTATLALLL